MLSYMFDKACTYNKDPRLHTFGPDIQMEMNLQLWKVNIPIRNGGIRYKTFYLKQKEIHIIIKGNIYQVIHLLQKRKSCHLTENTF